MNTQAWNSLELEVSHTFFSQKIIDTISLLRTIEPNQFSLYGGGVPFNLMWRNISVSEKIFNSIFSEEQNGHNIFMIIPAKRERENLLDMIHIQRTAAVITHLAELIQRSPAV